jgi:hypothetical protein
MCADIHDGQELCSTKGRIHLRKTNLTNSKASCDARPVHTIGSLSADRPPLMNVRCSSLERKFGLLPRSADTVKKLPDTASLIHY